MYHYWTYAFSKNIVFNIVVFYRYAMYGIDSDECILNPLQCFPCIIGDWAEFEKMWVDDTLVMYVEYISRRRTNVQYTFILDSRPGAIGRTYIHGNCV